MFATRPASPAPSSPSDIATLLARRKRSPSAPRQSPSPVGSRSRSRSPSPSPASARADPSADPTSPISHNDVPMTRTERTPPSPRRQSPVPRDSAAAPAPISPPPAARRGHVPPPPPAAVCCHGFVLAHTLPTATAAQKAALDPFALVPCPRETQVPPLTPQCASNCAGTIYCPAHWCGSCKRVARALAREERQREQDAVGA